jgi:hypothetical protein
MTALYLMRKAGYPTGLRKKFTLQKRNTRHPRAHGAVLVARGLRAPGGRRRRLRSELLGAASLRLQRQRRGARRAERKAPVAELHDAWRPRRPRRVCLGDRRDRRKRGIAYIGTGQGYSRPVGELTDALLALRLRTARWHGTASSRPTTCGAVFGGELDGKDWDIGASPNLFRIGRRDVVDVGDKGGRYATLDRKAGATVSRRKLCAGTHLGGIMTTAAVARGSGTFRALDARSGRVPWKARPGAPMGGGATVAGGAVLMGYGVQFGLNDRMMNPPPGSRGGIVAYTVRRR